MVGECLSSCNTHSRLKKLKIDPVKVSLVFAINESAALLMKPKELKIEINWIKVIIVFK